MEGIPKERRTAESITCIAVVKPNGEQQVFKGILEGYIADRKRGTEGFGYDEIFETKEGLTLAELDQEGKNRVSNNIKPWSKKISNKGSTK